MVEKTTPKYGVYNGAYDASVDAVAAKTSKENPDSSEGKLQLKRELGLFSATNLIIGVIIGSGIFVSPSLALEKAGSVGLCLTIWAVCGLISLLGALCFAELGLLIPRSGAEYVYIQEAFGRMHKFWGPLPSFLCSWVYVMVCRPAEVAVITLAVSEYICQPFEVQLGVISGEYRDIARKLISLIALGLLTYINYVSVKVFVRVQNIFTIVKLLACIIVIIAGLYVLGTGYTKNITQGFEGSNISLKHISLAFYYCLWPYDGWSTVTIVTEEVKRPEVNILRSILIAVPVVTAVYFLINVSYMTVLTIPEMIEAPAVAVVVADRTLGVFNFLIPLGVAMSAFGSSLSIQFSNARLCYVASKEGHMLEVLSYIHVRRFTPASAVILQGVLTAIFILAGNIATLIDFASFLIWIFYGLAMISLLILRKTMKDAERPFKVQLWIPVFMIFVSLFLCLVPIITDPSPHYFIALVLIALGVAVYIPFVFYRIRPRCIDKFTYFIQALMEVAPEEKRS